jgi:hypothetical protein
MGDETMEPLDPGMEQLTASLDGYARARLSPNEAAVTRMRARVMREASIRLPALAASAAPVVEPPMQRRGGVLRRRFAPLLVAAGFVLVLAGGVAAASQPGAPLFDLRVWVQTALLPSDPAERFDAELVALQSHLDDAVRAAEAGNMGALEASLDAYEDIMARVTQEVDAVDHAARLARLEDVLAKHQVVLERVLAQVPPQAQDAIEHAIDRSDRAIDVIDSNNGQGPGSNNGQGPGSNNGQGPGSTNGQGPGSTNAQGPSSTNGQSSTPRPIRTPPGHASERPSRGPGATD